MLRYHIFKCKAQPTANSYKQDIWYVATKKETLQIISNHVDEGKSLIKGSDWKEKLKKKQKYGICCIFAL